MVEEHLKLLGMKAKDKITGFSGIIDSISFDLYGCVQVSLRPPMDKDGECKPGHWLDVTRLKVKPGDPVMERPDFNKGYIAEGRKGPAKKEPV